MQNFHQKEFTVLTSHCDASARLSITETFNQFMDIASDHAQLLGVGYHDMSAKGVFWFIARSRVRFYRRPLILEQARLETWPAAPGRVRCERYYTLHSGEELLAEGRTEWAVMNLETGKVVASAASGYPTDLQHRDEVVCPGPFRRFADDFTPEEKVASLTVRPSDIDMGQHVNNVIYLRYLLDTFPVAQQKELQVREIELSYKTACFEGETLDIYRRKTEEGYLFAICHADGSTAVLAIMEVE